jgi:hypothetical protein
LLELPELLRTEEDDDDDELRERTVLVLLGRLYPDEAPDSRRFTELLPDAPLLLS